MQREQSCTESYLRMVMSPFNRENQTRYPDETLVPTSLAHFTTSTTYTLGTGDASLGWSTSLFTSLNNAENPIQLPGANNATGPTGSSTTYGSPQATYNSLASSDRTLAAGLRLRVTGLPVSTFVASGSLYFIQVDRTTGDLPANYANSTNGLSNCIAAISAGKGFSVTASELVGNDGIYIPYLPRGSNSFLFKDYALADTTASTVVGANSLVVTIPAGTFGSGQPPANINLPAPSSPVTYLGSVSGVLVADPILIVVGYGMQSGTVVQVDYAHHTEYVPRVGAAGLTSPEMGLTDYKSRDIINKGVSHAATHIVSATSRPQVIELYRSAEKPGFLERLFKGGPAMIAEISTAASTLMPIVSALLARR